MPREVTHWVEAREATYRLHETLKPLLDTVHRHLCVRLDQSLTEDAARECNAEEVAPGSTPVGDQTLLINAMILCVATANDQLFAFSREGIAFPDGNRLGQILAGILSYAINRGLTDKWDREQHTAIKKAVDSFC